MIKSTSSSSPPSPSPLKLAVPQTLQAHEPLTVGGGAGAAQDQLGASAARLEGAY